MRLGMQNYFHFIVRDTQSAVMDSMDSDIPEHAKMKCSNNLMSVIIINRSLFKI